MKKSLTSTLLVSLFIVVIFLFAGETVWIERQMSRLNELYYEVGERGYQLLYDQVRIEKDIVDMETGTRGYLLTGQKSFLEPYYEGKREVDERLASLQASLVDEGKLSPDSLLGEGKLSPKVAEIRRLVGKWIDECAEPAILQRQKQDQSQPASPNATNNLTLTRGKELMDGLRRAIDDLQGLTTDLRQRQVTQINSIHDQVVQRDRLFTGFLWLVNVLLFAFSYMWGRALEEKTEKLTDRERRLTLAVDELERASRLKSEFLANMSHELRTPLNAIIGFAQVLQKQYYGPLTEKQADYAGYILKGGQHLLGLINEILDLSKIEAGKMELKLSTFPLRRVLEDSLLLFKEKAARHRLNLYLEVDEKITAVEADESKVKQILYNLLSNAVKFTPDGGKIRVKAELKGTGRKETGESVIVVNVADTGIGIPRSEQAKLFQPFVQLDGSYTRKYEGTGLGLSLVKRLVELHGGRVWVRSRGPGKGSFFYFTLPVSIKEVKEDEQTDTGGRGQ